MKKRRTLLLTDSIINFILGFLLITYSIRLAKFLGVPIIDSAFYPNILGAIFIGIAIALLIEAYNKNSIFTSGLGLTGAVCINLCGGIVLFIWLVFGNLNLSIRGEIFLWSLDIVLILLSSFELVKQFKIKE